MRASGGSQRWRERSAGACTWAPLQPPHAPPAATFPGPGPTRRPLPTTLPGRTRARARALGPPPWRPCCPGRSSSRVRSSSLATTPPSPGLGRLGGEAVGAKPDGAWLQPARSCRRAAASRCCPAGWVQAPAGGEGGARRVGGRGREGPLRRVGRWPRAGGPSAAAKVGACRRCPEGRSVEGSILRGPADDVPWGPQLPSWAGPGRGQGRVTLWSSLAI